METVKIDVFKAMSERKIVMYRSFQKALDAIRDLVTSYDNKVINKRFIDKAQSVIDSVVPQCYNYYTNYHYKNPKSS